MTTKKNKNDIFVQVVGDVKKIKKSNRNFKKIKILKNNSALKSSKKPCTKNHTHQPTIAATEKIDFLDLMPSINKKIKRGVTKIDKRVDFHGLSVEEAKIKFAKTVEDCFFSQKRCILFITGKGEGAPQNNLKSPRLFHGKIRENFQKWIFEKGVSHRILNVVPAGKKLGGDGAFIVYLRRDKY